MEYDFVGRTVKVAARVQTRTRIHQADILVSEALRAELDARFVLLPMPAEGWKCLESSLGFNDLNGAKRLNGLNGWNKSPRRDRRARGHPPPPGFSHRLSVDHFGLFIDQ